MNDYVYIDCIKNAYGEIKKYKLISTNDNSASELTADEIKQLCKDGATIKGISIDRYGHIKARIATDTTTANKGVKKASSNKPKTKTQKINDLKKQIAALEKKDKTPSNQDLLIRKRRELNNLLGIDYSQNNMWSQNFTTYDSKHARKF